MNREFITYKDDVDKEQHDKEIKEQFPYCFEIFDPAKQDKEFDDFLNSVLNE